MFAAGRLNRRIEILARSSGRDSTYGTPTGEWAVAATVWAEVQDVLPSRADRVAEEIALSKRPARVRMRWREDVSMNNRLRLVGSARTMRIVAGPAMLGNREGLELMVEEMSTSGEEF
jgi:head-tail adaptor